MGGWRWTPTGEALAILEALSQADVTMQLLQTTHISRAVSSALQQGGGLSWIDDRQIQGNSTRAVL